MGMLVPPLHRESTDSMIKYSSYIFNFTVLNKSLQLTHKCMQAKGK